MRNRFTVVIAWFILVLALNACVHKNQKSEPVNDSGMKVTEKIFRSEEEWKKILTVEQYEVLRLKGTERPYTGIFDRHFVEGSYFCAGCGLKLFDSDSKFDAGCGWPSFGFPSEKAHIDEHTDRSYGMIRTEVVCSRCGGHLGHVFNDGPPPTGLRYCINSASLTFKSAGTIEQEGKTPGDSLTTSGG